MYILLMSINVYILKSRSIFSMTAIGRFDGTHEQVTSSSGVKELGQEFSCHSVRIRSFLGNFNFCFADTHTPDVKLQVKVNQNELVYKFICKFYLCGIGC